MSKTPIWAVTAPGTRKPRFTREQIATAALALADAEGFEALSMRRVADDLGAGTMTLYYYVRTKEDLLTLVNDAVVGEICDASEPLPKAWRLAIKKIAHASRTTYLRHPWAFRALTGVPLGPNGLRHIEQSLQAIASTQLAIGHKLELLSIVDDYVLGHCAGLLRRQNQPEFDRKSAHALSAAINRYLDEGDYPELRTLIGKDDPVTALAKNASHMTDHFDLGLEALLDGLSKRFKLK